MELRLGLLVAALLAAVAVDHSKFRTCEQGGFCRRYKQYVNRILGSGQHPHHLEYGNLQHSGHVVTAQIGHTNDPGVKPLSLELSFYKDALEQKCGIVRIFVTETSPLHPRFRLPPGDVILEDSELLPDTVTMTDEGGAFKLTASASGDCTAVVHRKPFEIEFIRGGESLQKLNGRHLLNFEQYRHKGTHHAGLVDAVDVVGADSQGVWNEHFGGHHDTKPRGPAAVGIDVTFKSASVLAGIPEHAQKLHLEDFDEPHRFFNLDVFEYELDSPMALYAAVPMAMALHQAGSASAFFVANPSEGFLKVEPSSDTNTWWLFESGVLDSFVFLGPTPQAVLQQYHSVTGFPRLPPLTTLGKHQCRWNYVDTEDVLKVNRGFNKHDMPVDVIWLDIEHTDGKKYFTWHPTHFKDPGPMLDTLSNEKRKLVTIIDPHIKREEGYSVFTDMRSMDMFTKTHSGQQYDGWCWPGTSYYPDFCSPAVRQQWATYFTSDKYPHARPDLYTWNDMNEPSVFNGPEVTMPRDNLHKCRNDQYNIEHRDVHNVYGLYHHRATAEGQMHRAPGMRPFVLTRSGFAGMHRWGAIWTGDNMAKWDHMERSVPMLLSLGLGGMSFAGADVPGFFYNPEPDLFVRWHQLGIWYPFYRGHAHLETKRREPWLFGDDATHKIREAISARYQLLPTWYTLYAEWTLSGSPVMRPLWFDRLNERPKMDEHVNNHFFVGEAVLVRALGRTDPGPKVDMFLPAGVWYDYWDPHPSPKEVKTGSVQMVAVHPLYAHPVFVQAGHILFKRMRRRRSALAMVSDPYSIFVYGSSNAAGRIYIDDGETTKHESGAFIYDEVTFDGTGLKEGRSGILRSQPVEGRRHQKAAGAAGLPDVPKRRFLVERLVFHGLPTQIRSTTMVEGEKRSNVEVLCEGSGTPGIWTATLKRPQITLGTYDWSIELHADQAS